MDIRKLRIEEFKGNLQDFLDREGHGIAGLSLAVTNRNHLLLTHALGSRRIDSRTGESLPMKENSLCRIASISKTFTALVALILEERNCIDLERDLSDYLSWELRNPHFPDAKITAQDILSHRSGLRDATDYNLPEDRSIRTLVEGTRGELNWDGVHKPGTFFSYCNLGYGILATVLEEITGTRFDLLAEEILFKPAGIGGSFNIQSLSDDDYDRMATLYRKREEDGQWIAQFDDWEGKRPPFESDYSRYVPGSNGTLFAPHGGVRTSAPDLAALIRLFLNKGMSGGERIIPESVLDRMMSPLWRFDRNGKGELNGDPASGFCRISGLGLFRIANDSDEFGGDSMLPGGGPEFWYHHGEAWGLLGGLMFDRRTDLGFAYLITGTSAETEKGRGKWSSRPAVEEGLQALILETFLPAEKGTLYS